MIRTNKYPSSGGYFCTYSIHLSCIYGVSSR